MRLPVITFWVATLAAIPSLTFGSGSSTTRTPINQSLSHLDLQRAQAKPASAIAEEPYNLGKALFSGKYRFGNPKLTAANSTEKKQRLVTLREALPVRERTKFDPILVHSLTNREMNALEYFVRMRFGKFVPHPPSWAKDEPPPQVASAP